VRAAIAVAPERDVAAIDFTLTCDGVSQFARVPLEVEGLPSFVDSTLQGHAFADQFFVVPPGICRVDLAPVQANGAPSVECQGGFLDVAVAEGTTTEAVVVLPCSAVPTGAIDVVVIPEFNLGPVVDEIVYDPSKEILACQDVEFSLVYHDPEGTAVSLAWSPGIVVAPPGADYAVFPTPTSVRFIPATPGYYVFRATLTDADGVVTLVDIPILVSFNLLVDSCDPESGCVPGQCNDGVACTIDTCDAGLCSHFTPDEDCDNVDNDCDGLIDESCACPVTGDVNGSSSVNVSDAQCVLLSVLWALGGQLGPKPACLQGPLSSADINCDGSVNVSDVQLAIRIALGLGLGPVIDPDGNKCAEACELDPCGNGVCEPQESCGICPADCGPCAPGG
jgi:hypothetical protein